MYGSVRGDEEGGVRRRDTSGAYFFFHTAVGSLGVIPSIEIFAKETCFQGAYLLNRPIRQCIYLLTRALLRRSSHLRKSRAAAILTGLRQEPREHLGNSIIKKRSKSERPRLSEVPVPMSSDILVALQRYEITSPQSLHLPSSDCTRANAHRAPPYWD